MDDVMTNDRDNYFIKWLEEKFNSQDQKLEANTKMTSEVLKGQKLVVKEQQSQSERLGRVESEVYRDSKLPPFYRDPKVIQAILYLALAILLAVAAIVRVDIGALL